MPAAQFEQDSAADAEAYVPAEQMIQLDTPVFGWLVPDAHFEQMVAAAAEYVPALQLVHVLAADAEYFPAAQVEHVDTPLAEKEPAAQVEQPDEVTSE